MKAADNFSYLFRPETIALIGASSDASKIGYRLADNILSLPYSGQLFLVNPKGSVILGKESVRSIDELPDGIDLAVLAIPKNFIMSSVEECIRKKVKNIIALTAGFKEIGEEGVGLEEQLKRLLEGTSTRLIGPNCAGLVNTWMDLHGTIEIYPEKGGISFISQSGSICSAFASNIAARSKGIAKFISLGNKVNVNEADLVGYLADDDETDCIALYLEDVADSAGLRSAAEKAAAKKPLVVFKSGSTAEGAKATFSHTGAMAGDDRLMEGAFRQMGILRVHSLSEMYDLAASFATVKSVVNNRIAILSDAGGPGVIAADAAVKAGLTLATLSDETKKNMYAFLPSFSSVSNPIDMTFTRDVQLYAQCIRELVRENIGAVIVTIPSHFSVKKELAAVLAEAGKQYGLPIFVVWLAADEVENERRQLWKEGIPAFIDPQDAALAVYGMYRYGEWQRKKNTSVP